MHVKIKSLTGRDKEIEIDGAITVLELKNMISEIEMIPPEQQRLVCNGRILGSDSDTLAQSRVRSGDTIHMVLALRGG